MNNSGKLSIPAAIIISSIILGGIYFAGGLYKVWARSDCAEKAGNAAVEKYKEFCEGNSAKCPENYEGMYLVPDFDREYETCIKYKGLKD